ncbi:helix-turn-helix domain-containing protein [Streptomyces sp. B-S-A8]|uniref:Helix-turn-helix domain-containing protein n=1 Tax=Streptomyces solicavernae TaxID=3043614 RepID=A0ABT6RU83_9ACTN|nr:helix-turn-helix domain-containing protein [Streptomyces sp. B-S-A8]MDI3387967.1 helix-turn-helix domain-containing protein [Streptomyces sp. B-S-A8]
MESTADGAPPAWALRRVASALSASGRGSGAGAGAGTAELARRTGLSKSLTRRCLNRLRGPV